MSEVPEPLSVTVTSKVTLLPPPRSAVPLNSALLPVIERLLTLAFEIKMAAA